jgi:dCMP deaminase
MSQPNIRPSWDQYFMFIATAVATRATCDRKHVGAVVVLDRRIIATGYNGSIRGTPHCDDVGHDLVQDPERGGPSCVRTVHAETNAIAQAAFHGVAVGGSTIYTTASPCWPCFKLIANAGIVRVVFNELYRDKRIKEYAAEAGIELVNFSGNETVTGELIERR